MIETLEKGNTQEVAAISRLDCLAVSISQLQKHVQRLLAENQSLRKQQQQWLASQARWQDERRVMAEELGQAIAVIDAMEARL